MDKQRYAEICALNIAKHMKANIDEEIKNNRKIVSKVMVSYYQGFLEGLEYIIECMSNEEVVKELYEICKPAMRKSLEYLESEKGL